MGEFGNVRFGEVQFAEPGLGLLTALGKAVWPDWAPSTHSPVNEAALQVAYHLNDGKLRDTGHSSEPAPPAAMAEKPE